jgi:hypothetical protein
MKSSLVGHHRSGGILSDKPLARPVCGLFNQSQITITPQSGFIVAKTAEQSQVCVLPLNVLSGQTPTGVCIIDPVRDFSTLPDHQNTPEFSQCAMEFAAFGSCCTF